MTSTDLEKWLLNSKRSAKKSLLRMDIYKLVSKNSTLGVLVYISSGRASSCPDLFALLGTSLRFLDPLDALEPGFGLPAFVFVWARVVAGH